MAYQVQSPYGQGSAIDTHLQGLVGAESDAANRGLAAANLAQGQQEMAQRGQIEQARLAQQSQLAGMEQQMQAERLASAERLQQGSQAFQAQQNQILIAEQRRIAEQEKKDAMEMMELDAQLTLAEAKGNEAAIAQLTQQKQAIATRRADAARNLAILGRQKENTPKIVEAMGKAIQDKIGEMKNQLDAKKKIADTYMNDVKGAITSLDLQMGTSALSGLRNRQNSGLSYWIGQDVPELSQTEVIGLQYLQLQEDMLGLGGMSGFEERSAGMVGGSMSDVSMTNTVADQTAQGLVKALAAVPGAKVDVSKASDVLRRALKNTEGTDFSQEFMQAGIEPEVGKIIMQQIAKDSQQESLRISSELSAIRAQGGQESLKTKALEAAARAYSVRAEQLARGASRIASMDLSQYDAMTESWGRLSRLGDYGGLSGLADDVGRLGLGEDYTRMMDLIGGDEMGPMLGQRQLEEREIAAGRALEDVGVEEAALDAELARLMAGSRVKGAEERLNILRSRMP